MVAGLALAVISLLAVVGGLRIGALLLFAFDCGFQPYELAVIPVALLGLFLCRSRAPETMRRLQSIGVTVAICAIVVALLIAVLTRWGFMLSSGGFP